jgi:hypothetical protein
MKQSILRLADFGDTAATTVALGGNLTNGTTAGYFTPLDGLWKQIYTDQALGVPLAYRYAITENTNPTYVAQSALATDVALQAMRNMYENIDARAFEGRSLVFQLTRSLWNNWLSFMEDKSLVFQLDRTEQGATKSSYRGIPIIVRNDWDRFIRVYHDTAATWHLPHRALLTDLNNIPIGTSDEGSLANVDSQYDFITKSWYLDFAYRLDMKILLEYALASAY